MKKLLCLLFLLPSMAFAGQIDYYLKFADEATALTTMLTFTNRIDWPLDYCVPNIQVWRASQDTTDAQGNVTHNFLAGFFVLCSLDRVAPVLRDLAAVQVVLDRDKANARQVGGVIKSNLTNIVLQDIRISPILEGSDVPFGNMK